jgi:hypothetical protein
MNYYILCEFADSLYGDNMQMLPFTWQAPDVTAEPPAIFESQYINKFPRMVSFLPKISINNQFRSEDYSLTVSQHGTFLRWVVVSTSSNPQDEGPPLFSCPRLFIQYIRSYLPYRRPFLHPQPADASCRDGIDPLITKPLIRVITFSK